ncbi:MarR family winged helix-turn-helix transcriptional regulator [Nocardia sp. alder85J]|uniref:MarR family winged helix-turn-helix transcriptional regulator n=1 Tax=Nocardia sp. alder85J TaxID=2862949 RepID=UPI001CD6F673|nr:MarR family transcriptional regulator [Nocardia sp. alder85J]MCX4092225.1 MarR family transcriptional regulator [Nocardia sp. alder85J]
MDGNDSIDVIAQQLIRLGRIRDHTSSQMAAASHGEFEVAAYGILFRLLHEGPMRSGALADALHSDASTISRQVAGLVKKGLIERRADPDDGRVSVLAVTAAGREKAGRIRELRNAAIGRILDSWNGDDRDQLAHLLRRFVDDFEAARTDLLAAKFDLPQSARQQPAPQHTASAHPSPKNTAPEKIS